MKPAAFPRKGIYFILSVSMVLLFQAAAEGGENVMSLYYPPDKSVQEFGLLEIVVGLPQGSAERLEITVNGNKNVRAADKDRPYQCLSVRTVPGVNSIGIVAVKGNTPVDSVAFTVFQRSDLIGEYRNVPDGYRKDHFHMKPHDECSRCHTLTATSNDRKPVTLKTYLELSSGKESAVKASTCYSCHKEVTDYPYVHGPASLWSCLSCHDPSADPVYSVAQPVAKVCYTCHTEQEREWAEKQYQHGPVTLGKCTICHSPHGSVNPFNLYKPVWNLCTTCHAEKASGVHVLSGDFSSGGHPTHNRMDPLRPGKELTCASCHNPHASDSPSLWAYKVDNIFQLCLKCHKDKL
jgi:predicted CXXCH cytochrome family protein